MYNFCCFPVDPVLNSPESMEILWPPQTWKSQPAKQSLYQLI